MVGITVSKGLSLLLVDLLMAIIVVSIGTGIVIYSINLAKEYRRIVTQDNNLMSKECMELSAALVRVGNYTYLIVNNYGRVNCRCSIISSSEVIRTLTLRSLNTTVLRLNNSNFSDLMIVCNSSRVLKPIVVG